MTTPDPGAPAAFAPLANAPVAPATAPPRGLRTFRVFMIISWVLLGLALAWQLYQSITIAMSPFGEDDRMRQIGLAFGRSEYVFIALGIVGTVLIQIFVGRAIRAGRAGLRWIGLAWMLIVATPVLVTLVGVVVIAVVFGLIALAS